MYSGYTWQMAAKKDTGKNAAEFVDRDIEARSEGELLVGETIASSPGRDNCQSPVVLCIRS